MEKEIWKTIEDFPNYEVSNLGNVRNKKRGILLKQTMGREGRYLSVYLCNNGKENTQRVHRLVAEAFLGKHPGMVVNHIDGDKLNNCLDNLEWCTAKENNVHAIKNGLNHPGSYQKRTIRIIETGETFDGVIECANATGYDFRNIYRSLNSKQHYAVNGLHFEYVDEETVSKPFLYPHQRDAIPRMFTGCILNGGTGSGKSRTGLAYYFIQEGGELEPYRPMRAHPKNLYIITTALKRDKCEWNGELAPFLLSTHPEQNQFYGNKVVVDSWNNIQKYADVEDAFFIFDEDKVTGKGVWVKTFLKIAEKNDWIILSATAGDRYEDYVPVFIANGFFRNRSEFNREHVVFSRFTKFPKVDRYLNTQKLDRLRDRILIDMDFKRTTVQHHEDIYVRFNVSKYKEAIKNRWDPYKQEPIQQASGLCYVLRRIVNEDVSRQVALLELYEKHPKMIVFYSFDYERDILLNLYYGEDVTIAEWSGHAHQPLPEGRKWVYLVQYTAGAEGWNATTTDTIVFFSQQSRYKILEQACGRVDRMNTPYTDLYYYHLKSRSGIDLAISKALQQKKKFNERRWVGWN